MAKATESLHIDIRPHIAAIARPGDTVMIGIDRSLTDEELDTLREQFEAFMDTTGVHVAVVENVTSMAVVRPDEDEEYRDAGAG